jgi:TolA-binding protein
MSQHRDDERDPVAIDETSSEHARTGGERGATPTDVDSLKNANPAGVQQQEASPAGGLGRARGSHSKHANLFPRSLQSADGGDPGSAVDLGAPLHHREGVDTSSVQLGEPPEDNIFLPKSADATEALANAPAVELPSGVVWNPTSSVELASHAGAVLDEEELAALLADGADNLSVAPTELDDEAPLALDEEDAKDSPISEAAGDDVHVLEAENTEVDEDVLLEEADAEELATASGSPRSGAVPWLGGAGLGAVAASALWVGLWMTGLLSATSNEPRSTAAIGDSVKASMLAKAPPPAPIAAASPAKVENAEQRQTLALQAKLKEEGYNDADIVKALEALIQDKKKLAVPVPAVVVKKDDRLDTLLKEKAAAEGAAAKLQSAVESAMKEAEKQAALIRERTEALAAVQRQLTAAAIRGGDAALGVEQLAAARDQARQRIVDAAKRLKEARYLDADANDADFLKALEKVIGEKATVKSAAAAPAKTDAADAAPAESNPTAAEKHFAAGLTLYNIADYENAETALIQAVKAYDDDARYFYFLGLAQLAQPRKQDEASASFRRAVQLERQDRPGRFAVNTSLERVQGPARRVLDSFRQ